MSKTDHNHYMHVVDLGDKAGRDGGVGRLALRYVASYWAVVYESRMIVDLLRATMSAICGGTLLLCLFDLLGVVVGHLQQALVLLVVLSIPSSPRVLTSDCNNSVACGGAGCIGMLATLSSSGRRSCLCGLVDYVGGGRLVVAQVVFGAFHLLSQVSCTT